MSCNDYQQFVHRHLDGEASKEEDRRLREHVKECESCRRDLGELKDIRSLIFDVGQHDRADVSSVSRLRLIKRIAAAAAILITSASLVWWGAPFGADTDKDPPPLSVAEAEPGVARLSSDASTWVVPIESSQPDVHIFWLYPDVEETKTDPEKEIQEEAVERTSP